MKWRGHVVIHLDDNVPVAKLCRALATHGLVISNGPDGVLLLHEGPAPVPAPAQGQIKSEPPTVRVTATVVRLFTREWWKR